MASQRNGFTLIELLVVIAIISILATILLPALNEAREMTKRVKCAGNLRAIGVGLATYSTEQDGQLPGLGYYPSTNSGQIAACKNAVLYPSLVRSNGYSWGPKLLVDGEYVPGKEVLDCPTTDAVVNWSANPYDWAWGQYCYWVTMRIKYPMKSDYTEINVKDGLESPATQVAMNDVTFGPSPVYKGRSSHQDQSGWGIGANRLYVDMHVDWTAYDDLEVIYQNGIGETWIGGGNVYMY